MPESAAPDPQADASRLEAATDQAIAACGGNARDAVKALIVANEYLESEVCELTQAVSHAYTRDGSKPIPAERRIEQEREPWPK
jgi:stage V sporulation protein SpoVS